MSFFRKLKDRLLKSSSRIEEGLEAIVAEGAAAGPADPEPRPEPGKPEPGKPEPRPEPGRPEPRPEPGKPEPGRPEPEEEPEPGLPEPPETPEPPGPEIPVPEPARPPAPGPAPEIPPATPQETPVEPEILPDPGPVEIPDTGPLEIPGDTMTVAGTVAETAPAAVSDAVLAERPGFLGRLLRRAAPAVEPRRVLDDAMLESLEELLIQADMGVDTALRVAANLAEGRMGRRLSVREIKDLLAAEIARIMAPVARPLPLYAKRPQVVLVVGVNGSGKTTTIGKLASQFRAAGKTVVIAAGDTFRAAAVEQLQVWGERAGVPVMTAPEGSDPASLAFDAMARAEAEGADLLLIDTAGRLQNRADLMEELAKIVRVIRKRDPDAPHNTLLVLDATTGQNALSQVEIFRRIADVSGLVMTKLDGTAKGGVLVALADRFGLPIHAIGVGEKIDDLQPFDPEDFARALVGTDAAA